MPVISTIGLVVAIGSALMSASSARAAAQAQMITAKANAEAGNITRAADNQFRGAQAALSNFSRAQSNKRILEAAGDQYKAFGQNFVRTMNDVNSQSIQKRLAASQTMGSMVAAASAAGVGGSSVDVLNSTFRRDQTISAALDASRNGYREGDIIRQQNGIMTNAVGSMDQGTSFANIDQSKNTPAFVAQPSWLGAAAQGISNAMPYVQQLYQHYQGSSGSMPAINASMGMEPIQLAKPTFHVDNITPSFSAPISVAGANTI